MKTLTLNYRSLYQGMVLLLTASSHCALADENNRIVTIKHNPFEIPEYIKGYSFGESGSLTTQNMTIRGVLISKKGMLININGSILGLHESIDGYELISLKGGQAVLSKNGEDILLTLPDTAYAVGNSDNSSSD